LFTLGIFFIGEIQDETARLIFNLSCYILATVFLSLSVMSNNALFLSFTPGQMTTLSLLSNFFGFLVNVIGLVMYWLLLPLLFQIIYVLWDISRENWWLVIFTSFTIIVYSPLVIFSPYGRTKILDGNDMGTSLNNNQAVMVLLPIDEKKSSLTTTDIGNVEKKPGCCFVIKNSIVSIFESFWHWRSDPQYFKCWLFVFGYIFYITSGTVLTIFIVPIFIDIYKLDLQQVSLLNLYYKIAMVVGILLGFVAQRFVKVSEVSLLTLQNFIFQLFMLVLCT